MLPTVLRIKGYRIFFYSNEGTEPPHIHVEKAGHQAKFWLEPIELASNDGFSRREIRELILIIESNRESFIEKWNEYFTYE